VSSGRLMHEAEELWNELSAVAPYPEGVLAVPEPIVGTAFFPGGFGLWNPAATGPLTLRKWQQGRMVGWHLRYAPCRMRRWLREPHRCGQGG
jgi:hypothetical protein